MNRYAIEVRALKILKPLGIAFFVLITVFPFLYMVLLSVRDISEVIESPGSLVPPLDEISAYQRVLRSVETAARASLASSSTRPGSRRGPWS
jgi:multiple sugar transport system permease protein